MARCCSVIRVVVQLFPVGKESILVTRVPIKSNQVPLFSAERFSNLTDNVKIIPNYNLFSSAVKDILKKRYSDFLFIHNYVNMFFNLLIFSSTFFVHFFLFSAR